VILDACLLVDGGYPYGHGWSGPWVHEHVSGLATLRFGVVHLGPRRELPREPRFLVPDHVERLVERFPLETTEGRPERLREWLAGRARSLFRISDRERIAAFQELEAFVSAAIAGRIEGLDGALTIAAGLGPRGLTPDDLLRSRDAYRLLERLVEAHAPDRPLAALVRAARAAAAPLVGALRTDVPAARVYHAVSTGPAGLLGAFASLRTGAPLLVTVPGAPEPDPTPERRDAERDRGVAEAVRDFTRRAVLSSAASVVTLSEASRRLETGRGASPEGTRVIPEGVEVPRFLGVRAKGRPTADKNALFVAFVGPIVPAKDAKTFLRAAKLLVERVDLIDLRILGDPSTDNAYARECLLHAQMLGIDRLVRFAGPPETRQLFHDLDCLVVSSAREGEPQVVVEAMAAGVPVVATDAGACRELLEGRPGEDQALGPAGLLAPVGDHLALAEAVVRVLHDHALRARLTTAGMARAERYYDRGAQQARYQELYESLAEAGEERMRALSGEESGEVGLAALAEPGGPSGAPRVPGGRP
jgi:glycosyltransferase involved in cell wall biosynthesis